MSSPTKYWEFAYNSIKLGLITQEEAKTIARVGHRKQGGYWARKLRDIEALVSQRLDERRVTDESRAEGQC